MHRHCPHIVLARERFFSRVERKIEAMRQPHVGLPQATDRSRIKRQSRAAGVASSGPACSNAHASGSLARQQPRLRTPVVDDTQNSAQTVAVHRRRRRHKGKKLGLGLFLQMKEKL
ncbi:hypothetical protein GW17_00044937 [Ensete ventricosum]|nr:hypothetical protein GW17_00044937 [Ensete ventricosum]